MFAARKRRRCLQEGVRERTNPFCARVSISVSSPPSSHSQKEERALFSPLARPSSLATSHFDPISLFTPGDVSFAAAVKQSEAKVKILLLVEGPRKREESLLWRNRKGWFSAKRARQREQKERAIVSGKGNLADED